MLVHRSLAGFVQPAPTHRTLPMLVNPTGGGLNGSVQSGGIAGDELDEATSEDTPDCEGGGCFGGVRGAGCTGNELELAEAVPRCGMAGCLGFIIMRT